MNTSNSDHDLNQQDDNVKHAYHSAVHDEPRAIIDDAIRAAARRAVSSQPQSIKKAWLSRWTTPLAAAATVMLTSSVIFMAVRDRPEFAPSVADIVTARKAVTIAPNEATKDAAATTPIVESGVTNERAEVAKAAAPVPARMQDSSSRAIPTPSTIASTQHSAATKQIAPPVDLAKAAPMTTLIAPPKVSTEIKAEAVNDLRAQDKSRKKQSDSEATAALTAEATGKLMRPPPAAVSVAGATVASPAPPQTRMMAASQFVPEPIKPRADVTTVAPPVAAAPAASAPSPMMDKIEKSPAYSPRAIASAAEKSDKIESADAWIKRMSELKRQEKNKELADEIARFRKRYPNVELPKELMEVPN